MKKKQFKFFTKTSIFIYPFIVMFDLLKKNRKHLILIFLRFLLILFANVLLFCLSKKDLKLFSLEFQEENYLIYLN
jgi:hypothetical protein